ncbi:type II toxin-antitoxin system YafQ family toxin [Candidatus Peregrinibacteria bacterium]|nr:type II toxin-antitoxin system YafQ family toxin [Candidatus Peregrinibacteria bacterium]
MLERKVIYHKEFKKSFSRLSEKEKVKVRKTIKLLLINPFHEKLRNHSLTVSRLFGKRSISPGYDLRIIFREESNYRKILFLDVGSHSKVY